MDNDELDKLFSSDEEGNTDEVTASGDEAVINEPEDTEIFVIEEETDDGDTSKEVKKEKTTPDKKGGNSKSSDEDKRKKKAQARKETIKDIEEFEAMLERRHQASLKAREEKRKNYVPLNKREFLNDFPLNFKQVIIILVGILILAVSLSVALMPSLRLKDYAIEGNYQVSDEEIIELIGMHDGDHLLRSYYGLEASIKKTNPYIKDINISFQYPSTLKVTITERIKVAYIQTVDGYAVIDKDGIVLELCSDYEKQVHPLLCGIEINSVALGQNIGVTDNLAFQKMVVILGSVLSAEQNSLYHSDYDFYDSLREVRILPSGIIFLTIELPNSNMLTVKLDEVSEIDDKMHWLLYAIEEGGMNKLPAGSLDMTEDSPIYHEYSTYG